MESVIHRLGKWSMTWVHWICCGKICISSLKLMDIIEFWDQDTQDESCIRPWGNFELSIQFPNKWQLYAVYCHLNSTQLLGWITKGARPALFYHFQGLNSFQLFCQSAHGFLFFHNLLYIFFIFIHRLCWSLLTAKNKPYILRWSH